MNEPLIALVTGANKGIGREIAAQLADLGHTVIIGARSAERGQEAAQTLSARGKGTVTSVVLDVTSDESVAAAVDTLRQRFSRIDALINNAGISHKPGASFAGQLPRSANVDVVRYVFETNVFGLIRVSTAFLPLLRASDTPRIVNVGSSAGSLTDISKFDNTDPIALAYVPSKTAVTAVTMMYARDLADEHILVNAINPGFVATDLNNHRGTGTAAEGARQAVVMATIPVDGPSGTFTDSDGPVAW